jgi:hypothetical protein
MQTSYGAAPNDIEDSLAGFSPKQLKIKDMIPHRLPLSERRKASV